MVRNEPTAEAWLAAIRAFNKLGMAMAAMIRMIATTISNSISEKPFCLRIAFFLLQQNQNRESNNFPTLRIEHFGCHVLRLAVVGDYTFSYQQDIAFDSY